MRSFYTRDAFGPQDGPSLDVASSEAKAIADVRHRDPGDYTIRDALGGLRARVRVTEGGRVDILERTK